MNLLVGNGIGMFAPDCNGGTNDVAGVADFIAGVEAVPNAKIPFLLNVAGHVDGAFGVGNAVMWYEIQVIPVVVQYLKAIVQENTALGDVAMLAIEAIAKEMLAMC